MWWASNRAIVAKSASNTPDTRAKQIVYFRCGTPNHMSYQGPKENNLHIGMEEEEEADTTDRDKDASWWWWLSYCFFCVCSQAYSCNI